jgi:WD40 repeat protein
VWFVEISQHDQLLASGSDDKTIKLWDPTTGALKHTLEGHSDSVWSVAFSQDGQLLASGSHDKIIKLWDPTTGALKHTLGGHSDWVQSVAFSQAGQLLASRQTDFENDCKCTQVSSANQMRIILLDWKIIRPIDSLKASLFIDILSHET